MFLLHRCLHAAAIPVLLVLLLFGHATGPAISQPAAREISARCQRDLAQRLSIPAGEVSVKRAERTVWRDASLGYSRPGKMYAQVLTPGWRVVLTARHADYLYHTSDREYQYGGPLQLALASALYLAPVPDEPNFNGNLMQISLTGTNPAVLLERVTAFYPQENGSVIAKRRVSRSGHELIYLAPGLHRKPVTLGGAFDFGAASISPVGKLAVYTRRALGTKWGVWVGDVAPMSSGTMNVLPLPDGATPDRLAWENGQLYAIVRRDQQPEMLVINTLEGNPIWKKPTSRRFPGEPSLMMNKSESLAAYVDQKNGVPSTRVVIEWFTGTQNEITTIPGFKVSRTLLGPVGGFAFLNGTKGGKQVVYVVDLGTKEAISFAPSADVMAEPFAGPLARAEEGARATR